MSRLKKTFFKTLGSLNAIFMTIDVSTTEKLIVNACYLVVTIVEKKNDIMI